MNAAASENVINFGETDNGAQALPATVSATLAPAPIPPGQAPAPTPNVPAPPLTAADASGYYGGINSGQAGAAGMTLGIVSYPPNTPPSKTAVAIFSPSSVPDTQTLYVIGDPANNVHPLQGLLVEDDTAQGASATDGGVDSQFLAKAVLTTPATISVDTFDVRLYGLQAPYANVRGPAIAAALAARQTDVICLAEVDYQADKNTISQQAANGNFPYSYWVVTDNATAPTDTRNWYGQVPPPFSGAACGPWQADGTMATIQTCASTCSTGPNGATDAGVTSLACLESACTNTAVKILQQDGGARCVDCIALGLADLYTIDDMLSTCGQDTDDPYGQMSWHGQNGTVVLSRFPFAKNDAGVDETEAFIFPGSSYRRVILRARLQLDSTSQMDVYCAQLVSPDTGNEIIQYVGQYATPDAGLYPEENTADNGWRDEDSLQLRDAIDWIKSQSGHNPAIVAGLWNSSAGYTPPDGGAPILEPHDPEVVQQFTNAGFAIAHPAKYTPGCSSCNTNPYNAGASLTVDGTIGFDWTSTYLYNFPPGSTLSDTFWNTTQSEWNVPVPTDAGTTNFPLSMTYPQTVQILRP